MTRLTAIQAEYNNLIIAINGYARDLKIFNLPLEDEDLKAMRKKAAELNKQILNFEK